ncbi:MAG: sulfotransferase, partial [Caulobacteraceae bacterium]
MTTTFEPPDITLAGIEAADRGPDRGAAIDLAIAAMGRGIEAPLVLRLVAEGLEEDGRPRDAAGLLERSTAAAPGDARGWAQYGRVLLAVGQPVEARIAHANALRIEPDLYDAHIGAGMVALRLGEVASSRAHYARAAELMPAEGEPLSALAVIAARQGDAKAARDFARRALALNPDFISAQIAVARADIMEGAPEAAEGQLTRLLARPDLSDDHRADCLSYLADALDALGRPAEAFAMYAATNARLERINAAPLKAALRETTLDQARRLGAWFEAAPNAAWATSPGRDDEGARTVAGHVFLMGFPRSGTTLLEQVLASHPGVVAIEERGMLSEAAGHFLRSASALERLARITPAGAKACREVYWRGVRGVLGEDVSDKVFIDKLPLHTVALPLIAKLFPDARILFAIRDPRDVALSCFRRRFRINAAMSEFLTLEGTARYYDAVMALAEIYRAKLPLTVHTVHHEALVADFEGKARAALEFIGVDWNPSVHGFAERARAGANTPSAAQLSRGLNADGVGAWRRYALQLAPILPMLEPWVERFGYPPGD